MPDRFSSHAASLEGPASLAFAISPHDSNGLPEVTRAIYVGSGGAIACRLADDSADVVLFGVPAGTLLPVRARFIRATGTTASNLVGLV